MVLLPRYAFKLILEFCDDYLEKKQRRLHHQTISKLKLITQTHPFSLRLRDRNRCFTTYYNDTNGNWYRWYLLRYRNKNHLKWYCI